MSKTSLEHFQDIKELEVADEQGLTVDGLLPYKCEQVEKSLKALEIIKKKNVEMALFNDSKTLEDYNHNRNWGAEELTQEEFNLLKEVEEK